MYINHFIDCLHETIFDDTRVPPIEEANGTAKSKTSINFQNVQKTISPILVACHR